MRSRDVLSVVFIAASIVAPVMSVPAPVPAELTGPTNGGPGTALPILSHQQSHKRQDIESEIISAIDAAAQLGIITQDEAKKLRQVSRLVKNLGNALGLLEALLGNPISLLLNSTSGATGNNNTTQGKRDQWSPLPIPTPPPIPAPPTISSCWSSGSCGSGADLD